MNHRMPAFALAAGAALLAVAAGAQQPQPQAEAPAFRSALEGYQPYAEQPVAPWRESNDTVGRIGGWRAYAREAQQGASAPAAAASSPRPQAPEAAPRSGHGHH